MTQKEFKVVGAPSNLITERGVGPLVRVLTKRHCAVLDRKTSSSWVNKERGGGGGGVLGGVVWWVVVGGGVFGGVGVGGGGVNLVCGGGWGGGGGGGFVGGLWAKSAKGVGGGRIFLLMTALVWCIRDAKNGGMKRKGKFWEVGKGEGD